MAFTNLISLDSLWKNGWVTLTQRKMQEPCLRGYETGKNSSGVTLRHRGSFG